MTSPAPGPVDIQHEFCPVCEDFKRRLFNAARYSRKPGLVQLEWWEHITRDHTGKDVAEG